MMDTLQMYFRFLRGLRDFYGIQTSLEQARLQIRQRIREREQNFLNVLKTAVFGWPKSPYLWLFRQVSCEFGDVEKLVANNGLDDALVELRTLGVYVAFEEFKGRKPMRRGSGQLEVKPADFYNPYLANVYYSQSGGTTGAGARIPHDLDHLRLQAAQQAITKHAHGVLGLPTAIWCGVLPDGAGVNYILRSGHIGHIPEKWFSPTSVWRMDPATFKFHVASLVPVIGGRLAGLKMPFPETLPLAEAVRIAQWAEGAIRRRGACLVNTSVSRAVRVCVAAKRSGIDLHGATFRISGEPVSLSKAAHITEAGAQFYTSYAQSEAGRIAEGCCAPADPSDVHLLTGFCAMISYPRKVSGVAAQVNAFHLTTLLPQAPIIMLNTELDDCGTIEQRSCGCPLEELGMKTHLSGIYSYDKLTSEGVTLLGSDLVRILEEVLPGRLGGTAQDYQFVEAENQDGFTRLSLLVSPRIRLENEQMVKDIVLGFIQNTGPAGADARAIWDQAGTLQIERREPVWTDRGKLLTLFKSRSR